MENLGLHFRSIRQEKGVTIETCSHQIISKAGLSKFERGQNDITLSKFLQLLDRLNISLDEFLDYINISSTPTFFVFLDKVKKAFKQKNIPLLFHYSKIEEDLFKESRDISYRIKSTMVLILINSIDETYEIESDKVTELSDYLFEKETWYLFELLIFRNSTFALKSDLTNLLITDLIRKANSTSNLPRYNKIISEILLNATITQFYEGNLDMCYTYLNQIPLYLSDEEFYYKYLLEFLKECLYLKINSNTNYSKLFFLLDIMELLGEDYQIVIYKQFVEDHFDLQHY